MKTHHTVNPIPIYEKILCQKDYLTMICKFLRMNDIFKLLPSLSTFHIDYLNNESQLNMIKQCLYYDFGDILNVFKIDLSDNDDNDSNSICCKIGRFYDDWDYLTTCAKNTGFKIDEESSFDHLGIKRDEYVDFKPLMTLETNQCIQYWIEKVTPYVCDARN